MIPSTFDQEGIWSFFFFFNAHLLKDKVLALLCAHVSER